MGSATNEVMSKGLSSFSLKLYRCLSTCEGNVFVSPHSVSTALMLTCLGAGGDTEKQILTALGLGDEVNPHDSFRIVGDCLKKAVGDGMLMKIANRLFVRREIKPKEKFVRDSSAYYESGIDPVDFGSDPDGSRMRINTWVEEQTNSKVKNLLAEDSINCLTTNVLVNAMYFKGKWEKPFDSQKTVKTDFHLSSSNTTSVEMMNSEFKMPFLVDEDLGITAAELPYQDGTISLVVFLPKEVDGISKLEQALSPEKMHSLCSNLSESRTFDVIVSLPKFKLEQSCNLTEVLAKIGVVDLFTEGKADLSGLLEGENTHICDVVHKSFIDVNEEGTEAAAATAMIGMMRMMPMPKERLNCDRPFMFALREKVSGTFLFIGRLSNPANCC